MANGVAKKDGSGNAASDGTFTAAKKAYDTELATYHAAREKLQKYEYLHAAAQ